MVTGIAVGLLGTTKAQTVVESMFVPAHGFYSDPANWSPAEVPNDTATRLYNVTLGPNGLLNVDINASISNLRVADGREATLSLIDRTFTVTGTTVIPRLRLFVTSYASEARTFNAGTLSSFSNGALTGEYALQSYGTGAAALQFRGANVLTLRDADLALTGLATQVIDENGNDALRNLSEVDAASKLRLDTRPFLTSSPLWVAGALELGGFENAPTIFTALASLTNFDSATRTLTGGTFVLGQSYTPPGAGPIELRFAGADIVNNGSALTLVNQTSRITDLNGLDGLRNLARNLPEAALNLHRHEFVTAGDFTNDGLLNLQGSRFVITGTLRNFDAATRTLSGGIYELESELRFRGADIVHNGASLSLGAGGKIVDEVGTDALRNFNDNLSPGSFVVLPYRDFIATGDFRNAGRIETGQTLCCVPDLEYIPGIFTIPAGARYTQTSGETVNNGTFTADNLQVLGGSLSGAGTINGNVTITDATVQPGGTINGNLTLSAGSHVQFQVGEYSIVNQWHISGEAVLAGTLEVRIGFENFIPSSGVLTLIRTSRPLTGSFSNAPQGTRIISIDGSGSFVVLYDGNSVKLTGFRANPPTAQLLNISTRGYLKRGGDVLQNHFLIGGFIITGTEPKTIIARGIGPSLAQRSVGAPLNDPSLRLHASGGGSIATNNDWRDTQQAEIEASSLAPENERESAIKATLSPGAYTVVMQETNGLPGTGLVEVYDLSPNTNSKLGNISTRGFIEPGGVLIGGIIAGGEGQANAEIVVRAIGPRLRLGGGVFNAVEDPTVELRDRNGSLVASSEDPISDQSLPVPRELRTSSRAEPAMHLSLPRGNYTAILRSKSGNPGTALVEFYDLRR